MLNLVFSFYLGLNYIFLPHRPNNLDLSMKTKPVTSGEDATAYVQYLYMRGFAHIQYVYPAHKQHMYCCISSIESSFIIDKVSIL